MTARFRDKVVVISGACGGIGHATAKRFAAEGASLVLADLIAAMPPERMAAMTAEYESAGARGALFVPCDVAAADQVAAAMDAARQRFGRIDVVVNLAGCMLFKRLIDLTADDWRAVLGVNLLGATYFTREALRCMNPGGSIVNVSSIHALQTSELAAPYAAAKAALLSLTRSTAIEGRSQGVRANAILPGAIDTPMLHSNPNLVSGAETISPDQIGRPEDVAAAVAFLASRDAAFISGTALNVDGGRLAAL